MRSGLLTIIKKEMTRFFKDRRMILTTIFLPGILIYGVYSLMGSALTGMNTVDEEYIPTVYTVNLPDSISALGAEFGLKFEEEPNPDFDAIYAEIEDKNIDVLVVFPQQFDELVSKYEIADGAAAPNIDIFYNSADTQSSIVHSAVVMMLDTYESTMTNKFDVNNLQKKYDLASDKDASGQYFSMMLPMLMMIFLFSGCMAVAPESIAGEKERGTIATLLITPMKRSQLAIGKIISVSVVAILSATSSFIGTFLSLPKLMGGVGGVQTSYYVIMDYVLILLVLFSTVLLFVGLIAILSAYAKTVKEAGALITPLMIIIMLVGVTAMFGGGAKQDTIFYLIPVYNSVQCLSGIFSFSYSAVNIGISILSNVVYTFVCVAVLTKMFNSEKIIFSK